MEQIQMVLRSLQPRITRHVVGVPFTDFSSLVSALYDVEDSILRGLWTDSFPSDVKEKKPFGGQRSIDVSAISSSSQRPLGVICQSRSFPRLIIPIHLSSIGHGRLVRLMITLRATNFGFALLCLPRH